MRKAYNKRKTGTDYERLSGEFLEKNGYHILQYNYRGKFGEIDIVAMEDGYLVFCEVKYRYDDESGDPAEAVDQRKQKKICSTALQYLYEENLDPYDTDIRFDVITIEGEKIDLIKNAFDYC